MSANGPGWAQSMVATWAGARALQTLSHARRVRGAYNNEPLHGLCARYAALLETHADELRLLEQELLREVEAEKEKAQK